MPLKKTLIAAGLLLAAIVSDEAYADPLLRVENPWVREVPPSAPTAAAYFQLVNQGDADLLQGVETPVAGRAEMHQHIHQDGLMKMRKVDSVAVPAHGGVAFAPMGYHVMLLDLRQPIVAGQQIPLILHFQHAGAVEVRVPVTQGPPAAR